MISKKLFLMTLFITSSYASAGMTSGIKPLPKMTVHVKNGKVVAVDGGTLSDNKIKTPQVVVTGDCGQYDIEGVDLNGWLFFNAGVPAANHFIRIPQSKGKRSGEVGWTELAAQWNAGGLSPIELCKNKSGKSTISNYKVGFVSTSVHCEWTAGAKGHKTTDIFADIECDNPSATPAPKAAAIAPASYKFSCVDKDYYIEGTNKQKEVIKLQNAPLKCVYQN